MILHGIVTMIAGYVLDLAFGDPVWLYHPVCAIGKLISSLEKLLRRLFPKTKGGELTAGALEALLVCAASFFVPWGILHLIRPHCQALTWLLEIFWCYQLLATRSLKTESMRVYDRLKNGTLEEARYAVSMIVGRDTQALSAEGVTKAAVETIAENTSDGILAPMFYMTLGGVPLMFLYKGINTMDSMLGYKNEKYLYFGRCAAKLDDAVNYLPSRIAAWIMIFACFFLGMDAKRARKIYLRDRRNHASPNSAQTEAVMAGALGVQLAGNAFYFGKLYEKPTIGDPLRPVEAEDIPRANRLLYASSFVALWIFLLVRSLLWFALYGMIL